MDLDALVRVYTKGGAKVRLYTNLYTYFRLTTDGAAFVRVYT